MSHDADSSIHLHAELLPNIRQLTFYVSLPAYNGMSEDGNELKAEISLSGSRRAVTVSISGPGVQEAETMKLPARVSEASRGNLKFPEHRAVSPGGAGSNATRQQFSFRMQVDKCQESNLTKDEFVDDLIPWTAADMSAFSSVRCRECGLVILNSSKRAEGWTWKDLPSGNWAEMMDFWHCHKPDTHEHDHEHGNPNDKLFQDPNAVVKGYGAANQVLATPGAVLVDVPSFLVAEMDCTGLRKQSQPQPQIQSPTSTRVYVGCEGCGAAIGTEDTTASGWRLFKANLAVKRESPEKNRQLREGKGNGESDWETFPKEIVVGAQLLEMIEREGARRFIIHYGEKSGLLLWVFNPDLRYSSSSPDHSVTAQRAMKVFFQHVSDVESMLNPEQGNAVSISLEELYLPVNIFKDVSLALKQSNEILPGSARSFREWEVGFLSRLDEKSTT